MGVTRQTLANWQEPTKLIDKRHLRALSHLTGVPYERLLDALLEDIGYRYESQESAAERAAAARSTPDVVWATDDQSVVMEIKTAGLPPDDDLEDLELEGLPDPVYGEGLEQRAARKRDQP